MKKEFLVFTAILAIAAGCSKETIETTDSSVGGEKISSITRIFAKIVDTSTKATLDVSDPDCYKQVWEENDEIAVTDISDNEAVKFNYVGDDGSSVGDFEIEQGQALSDTDINRYAVYPYASFKSVGLDKEGDVVTVIYPAQQTLDSYSAKAEGNNLMLAQCKFDKDNPTPTFYFKNICAYMQLNVAPGDNGDKIRAIIIKSLSDKVINGHAEVTVDAETGEISSIEFDEQYGNSSSVIACYDEGNAGIDITGEPIYVALPPIIAGFSVTVVTCDGLSMTKKSSTDLEIGTFVTMPEFEFSGTEPEIEIPEEGSTCVSFKEALEVANSSENDCTIKLNSDCYITELAEFNNLNNKTLDLDGHKLYEVGIDRIKVAAGATLTIKGEGEIIQESAGSYAIDVYGTLKVEEGVNVDREAVKVHDGGSVQWLES